MVGEVEVKERPRPSPDYLMQLLNEKKLMTSLPNLCGIFTHLERLLDEGKWRRGAIRQGGEMGGKRDRGAVRSWRDLAGRPRFTAPGASGQISPHRGRLRGALVTRHRQQGSFNRNSERKLGCESLVANSGLPEFVATLSTFW